jgi:predicted Zn-dependent protease with MMP-like domain
MNTAPGLEELEGLALDALSVIPEPLRAHVGNVAIQVEEFPDEDVVRDMELETPFDLLGLYQGISLDRQSLHDIRHDVDRIFLYRRPLLDYWCETGEDLRHLIRHVLIHEIGHHFGLSDDDMEALEAQADIEAAGQPPEPGPA